MSTTNTTASTAQANEITFYSDEHGIRVTNIRLTCGSMTYSMANLTSVAVKRDKVHPNIVALLSVCLVIWGIASSQKAATASLVGAAGTVIFLGAFIIAVILRKWSLTITSSSGEISLIRSRKKDYVEKIAHAVEEALTQRGKGEL